jgi:hypothetical protein
MFLLLVDFQLDKVIPRINFPVKNLIYSEFFSLVAPQYRSPFFPQTKIT